MKNFAQFFLILAFLFTLSCQKNTEIVTSPDGNLHLTFQLRNGHPFYAIEYQSKKVILPSGLGFKLKDATDLLGPFKMIKKQTKTFDQTWHPVWGTDKNIRNQYNEMRILLKEKKATNRRMTIVFRMFNDGLGFRYEFPRQQNLKKVQITSEETYFKLTGGKAWWIPGNYESYEFLYHHTPLAQCDSCATPFTVETNNGLYISLHEAALYDYAGMTLQRSSHDSTLFKSKLVPWPDGIKVKTQTPFKTPWRTIMIADQPGKLIESHLIQNLNTPSKIKDTSWIKPMKYVGIWWGMHIGKWTWYFGPRHGATTERAKQYINFASKHGIPGLLAEGWNKGWETWLKGKNIQDYLTPYPDFDLKQVVEYGKKKGVFLIGHNETGGNVPNYEKQIDAAFEMYEQLGIPAVKTGYAGRMYPPGMHHHSQWMVRHYQRVVEKAARHHLMIDAHEPIKDTGISRTWPNFMSREGARGMEYNAWSEGNPPEHTVILPFTRFLAGPMDYTPGIFNLTFDSLQGHRVYTTLAKQLAYYVVLFSPLQMAADLVENYQGQPAFKFIEDVPVNWDKTIVLKAKIGDYLSIARQKGKNWYIGSITDEKARHFSVPLSFLDKGQNYKATIYTDALKTNWRTNPTAIQIKSYLLTDDDSLQIVLSPSGGQAVELVPITAKAAPSLPSISVFNKDQKKKVEAFARVLPFGHPIEVKNMALGKTLHLDSKFNSKYSGGGANALIDGILGETRDFSHWQGFRNVPLKATINLGFAQPVHRVAIGFLLKQASWAFLPKSVLIFVSDDGRNFKKVLDKTLPAAKKNDAWRRFEISKNLNKVNAKYVKVVAVPLTSCPDWHSGHGQPPWLFADEIIIR